MFAIVDKKGEKHFAFNETKEVLRNYSYNKEIFCPHCLQSAIFHGGDHRTFHFKHAKGAECTYKGEPESEEHLTGKRLIYEWLIERYPKAKVELEYSIKETNQIADVYVEFDEKHKFAFEVQCSVITHEIWSERYNLYQSVGIQSVWLFGSKYDKEIEDNTINKKQKCLKLRNILIKILEELGSVYFIDAFEQRIKHSGELYNYNYWNAYITDTKFALEVNEMLLQEMQFVKVKHRSRYLVLNNRGIQAYEQDIKRRKNKAKAYWNEKIKKQAKLKSIQFQQNRRRMLYEDHKNFLRQFKFSETVKTLSVRDRVNLNRVSKELKLTDENFPGIFLLRLKDYDCIKTPYYVWQPLVFHKAIFHCYHQENLIFFEGVFNYIKQYINFTNENKARWLVNSYLVILEKAGFIEKKRFGFHTPRKMKHPYQLQRKFLPLKDDLEWNKKIALYYSEFNYKEIGWEDELDYTVINKGLLKELRRANESLLAFVSNYSDELIVIELDYFDWIKEFVKDNSITVSEQEKRIINDIYMKCKYKICLYSEEYEQLKSIVEKFIRNIDIDDVAF